MSLFFHFTPLKKSDVRPCEKVWTLSSLPPALTAENWFVCLCLCDIMQMLTIFVKAAFLPAPASFTGTDNIFTSNSRSKEMTVFAIVMVVVQEC